MDLLLLDASNPRSVRYQLDRLIHVLSVAPNPRIEQAAAALVASLASTNRAGSAAAMSGNARASCSTNSMPGFATSPDQIQQAHFVTQLPAFSFRGA